jgi:hypothetical protein
MRQVRRTVDSRAPRYSSTLAILSDWLHPSLLLPGGRDWKARRRYKFDEEVQILAEDESGLERGPDETFATADAGASHRFKSSSSMFSYVCGILP